jgi:hypothetical protein
MTEKMGSPRWFSHGGDLCEEPKRLATLKDRKGMPAMVLYI